MTAFSGERFPRQAQRRERRTHRHRFCFLDEREHDRFLPDSGSAGRCSRRGRRFVAGGRAIYSGVGTVDATVNFAGLARSAVRSTGGALVVSLPHATLGAAQLVAARSHVMNRDRGVLDRLGGIFVDSPTSDHELEQIARRRIESAAARSQLRAKAEHSTARMVTDLAHAMGVDHVDVRFGTA